MQPWDPRNNVYYEERTIRRRYGSSYPSPNCCYDCHREYIRLRETEERMQKMYLQMTERMMMNFTAPVMLVNGTDQLQLTDGTSKGKKMNVVKKLKNLSLDKGDRLLRKYEIVSESGDLTPQGKEVLFNILLTEYKEKLVAQVTELEKTEKAKKK